MGTPGTFTLRKAERVTGKKLVEEIFSSGSRSIANHPLRLVYRLVPRKADKSQAVVLFSVPKRHLKRAVWRNRVKRQLRESYRLNKQILYQALSNMPENQMLAMAFIWQEGAIKETQTVEYRVRNLLERLAERL